MIIEGSNRDKERNPFNPMCKLAYRRICGVCQHFQGDHMRDTAGCSRFNFVVNGRASASDCDEWTRKVAK